MSAPFVAVVDYGSANLRSVWQAVEHAAVGTGWRVSVISDAAHLAEADRVILPGQGAMHDCMRALDVSGLPLGTFDGVSYDEITAQLGQGDVVVLFSDGLVEARRGREEYGTERLLRGLEAHAELPAPELGERLLGDLEAFLGEATAADDVTLLVVKVL